MLAPPGTALRAIIRPWPIAVALLLFLGALTTTAQASPEQVLRDCVDDGEISQQHSFADLREALRNMPAETAEYSDCAAIIKSEIARPRGSRRGAQPGGRFAANRSGRDRADSADAPTSPGHARDRSSARAAGTPSMRHRGKGTANDNPAANDGATSGASTALGDPPFWLIPGLLAVAAATAAGLAVRHRRKH